MTNLIVSHPDATAVVGIVVYAVENILPHLPVKANSTVQLVLGIFKLILPKKK